LILAVSFLLHPLLKRALGQSDYICFILLTSISIIALAAFICCRAKNIAQQTVTIFNLKATYCKRIMCESFL
jgi:hypothetical protein